MRVFLDTNVLVSAIATRGLSADVLRSVLSAHELVTSEVVLEELDRVLERKLGFGSRIRDDIRAFLLRHHVEPGPEAPADITLRDPDDAWVLASALNAGAHVLVTGDRDLLDVASRVADLTITDPRGFWRMIGGSESGG